MKRLRKVVDILVQDAKYVFVSFPLNVVSVDRLLSLHPIWQGHIIISSQLCLLMRCLHRLKTTHIRSFPTLVLAVNKGSIQETSPVFPLFAPNANSTSALIVTSIFMSLHNCPGCESFRHSKMVAAR